MIGTDFADRFVTLRNGLVVPAPAYLLLLELERRDLQVRRDGDDLLIGPRQLLTDDDRQQIRLWKRDLVALVRYCEQPANDAHLFHDDEALAADHIRRAS